LIFKGLKLTLAGACFPKSSVSPPVSIVVAVRNEESNIIELLESLSNQNYSDFEVIIVDDSSNDNTRKLAEEFCHTKANFHIVSAEPNILNWGPKKNALNTGIKLSSDEIIVTTDADCRPKPGWLKGIVREFKVDVGAVVGYSPLRFPTGIAGRLKSLEALATGIISAAFIGIGRPFIATGRNFAYRRAVYMEIGGFGERGKAPAGDDDLLLQAIAKYEKIVYSIDQDTIVPSYQEPGNYIARKQRHFTVARHYPLYFLFFGMIVFMFLLSILVNIIYGVITVKYYPVILGLFALIPKIFLDYILLTKGAKMLKEKFIFTDMILAELAQIPYTLILQPISLVGKFEWRGRRL
jgi:glycosyltransferase involved in cell wall biosynthesis